jgi:hypothetical protein
MNRGLGRWTMAIGAAVVALGCAPGAWAACGGFAATKKVHPSAWTGQPGQVRLLRTAGGQDLDQLLSPPIVGFWHVKFISDGENWGLPPGVSFPKGSEQDAGYSQWHSDGTEIMNSGGRAPNTDNFCLGVWAQTGPRTYQLNHFATPWDPTAGSLDSAGNPVGVLIGPANIREQVTLSLDAQSFSGPYSIEGYDENNDHIYHIEGTVYGTRITVNTPASPIF